MPISDGFEACEKIHDYIDSHNELDHDPGLLRDFTQYLMPVFTNNKHKMKRVKTDANRMNNLVF